LQDGARHRRGDGDRLRRREGVRDGAQVVLADRESEPGKQTAAEVGGLFVRADSAAISTFVNDPGGLERP
jgi:hypothetical protein